MGTGRIGELLDQVGGRVSQGATEERPPRRRRAMRYVRMDDEEWAHVRERAEACGLSASCYLREAALGTLPRARRRSHELEVVRQLAHLGNQLDRLTQAAEPIGEREQPAMLQAVLTELLAAIRRLG